MKYERLDVSQLRARHYKKAVSIRAKIAKVYPHRDEITNTQWECPDCGEFVSQAPRLNMVIKPFQCNKCGNRHGLKLINKELRDVREMDIGNSGKVSQYPTVRVRLTGKLVDEEVDKGKAVNVNGVLSLAEGKRKTDLTWVLDADGIDVSD